MITDIKSCADIVLRKLLDVPRSGEQKCADYFISEGYSDADVRSIFEYIKDKTPDFINTFIRGRSLCGCRRNGIDEKIRVFLESGGYVKFDNYDEYLSHVRKGSEKELKRIENQDTLIEHNLRTAKISWIPIAVGVFGVIIATCSFLWNVHSRHDDNESTQSKLDRKVEREELMKIIEQTTSKSDRRMDSLWRRERIDSVAKN